MPKGFITKADIAQVRERTNLYDLISDDVNLKQSGSQYMGLCPFHDEKTPSFSVSPTAGYWHCFGCGKSGDCYGYVMERDGVEFREAVEILADRCNYELHYEERAGSAPDAPKGVTRTRLLAACAEAQKFFASNLMSGEALPARQLLAGRKFDRAACEYFGCGYAPGGGSELVRHLSAKGFTVQEMTEAGLARQGARGPYDYFRGRLTWPIRDATGRTLGFGARKLHDDDRIEAKYINTPDTRLYQKNKVLYGLDLAKDSIRKNHRIVVVEGYTDVMACHLAGLTEAVATCGTAFGEEHAKMARRLIADNSMGKFAKPGPGADGTSRIVFTFDGDSAGRKAALHAFSLDAAFLSQTFVAIAENGLDPCDLRIQKGDDAVRSLIIPSDATRLKPLDYTRTRVCVPLYRFVIDTQIAHYDLSGFEGREAAAHAVAPLIAHIRDRSLCGDYTRYVSAAIGYDPEAMQRLCAAERRRANVRDEDIYAPPAPRAQDPASGAARGRAAEDSSVMQGYHRVDDTVFRTEQDLMALVIQLPLSVDRDLFALLSRDSFVIPVFADLYDVVVLAGGLPQAGTGMTTVAWVSGLVEQGGMTLRPVIEQLASMNLPGNAGVREETAGAAGDLARQRDRGAGADGEGGGLPGPATPLLEPTAEERKQARAAICSVIDSDIMRRSAALRARMNDMPEGDERFRLVGQIAQLNQQRARVAQLVNS